MLNAKFGKYLFRWLTNDASRLNFGSATIKFGIPRRFRIITCFLIERANEKMSQFAPFTGAKRN